MAEPTGTTAAASAALRLLGLFGSANVDALCRAAKLVEVLSRVVKPQMYAQCVFQSAYICACRVLPYISTPIYGGATSHTMASIISTTNTVQEGVGQRVDGYLDQ